MTREKHRNARLTKSEPSQDRIGLYPMFVLGSIQRNDGLLEEGRQGRIYLGQLPKAGRFPEGLYLGDRQVLMHLRKTEESPVLALLLGTTPWLSGFGLNVEP